MDACRWTGALALLVLDFLFADASSYFVCFFSSCIFHLLLFVEITFFGESLPESFRTCLQSDRHEADLVIVMGSSLKVQPVAGMLELFDKSTPMILINREVVGEPDEFDVEVSRRTGTRALAHRQPDINRHRGRVLTSRFSSFFFVQVLGLADDVCAYLADQLKWKLPEVDPSLDTFRELSDEATGEQQQQQQPKPASAPAASSSSNLAPPPPLNVSLSSPSSPPLPAAPLFIAPNRYLFPMDSAASPTSSQSSSPESSAQAPAAERQAELAAVSDTLAAPAIPLEMSDVELTSVPQLDALLATPRITSHPLSTPVFAASSSSSSPRLHPACPPPLQLSSTGGVHTHSHGSSTADQHVMSDMNLTCTPTKSSRFLPLSPHVTPITSSPLFKPMPTPALNTHGHQHTHAAPQPASCTGKRKGEENIIDDSTPPIAAAGPAGVVPAAAAAASAVDVQSDATTAVAAPASDSSVIHQPQVKRRKVSVPLEKKEE